MIAPQQLGFYEPLPTTQKVQSVMLQDFVSPSTTTNNTSSERNNNLIEFHDAWKLQRELLQAHLGKVSSSPPTTDQVMDTILFVEHAPVYTLGTASDASFILSNENTNTTSSSNIPIVRMDRGGEVTYHGPGQLTVYPILNLHNYRKDIHWYVRALEQVVIVALRDYCGLDAVREEGVTGVWVHGTKVAAVGIKCQRWITQHGVAINVGYESLENFGGIVPCGLVGREVGCVQQFVDRPVSVAEMAAFVGAALEDVFQIALVEK